MSHPIIQELEKRYLKPDLPVICPGDTIKVHVRIREGSKERIQGYEGVVIKKSGGGISQTITVRRVFQGVGIERVFMVHSPKVDRIDILRRGDVRRAKLYYLRDRAGKAARIREKTTGYAGKLVAEEMKAKAKAKSGKGKRKKQKAQQEEAPASTSPEATSTES